MLGRLPSSGRVGWICITLLASNVEAIELRQLTFDGDAPGAFHSEPAWSPDGSRIAFTWSDGSRSSVVIVSAETGTPVETISDAGHPTWSPDGKQIAFVTAQGIQTADHVIVRHGTAPNWSPDVRLIAYEANDDVWASTPDGRTLALTQHSAQDRWPVWSPDGKKIAFASNRLGDFDIWVLPVFGGYPRRLTTDPGDETHVSWSPDGRLIAYVSAQSGNADIWLIPAAGGEATRLTEHPAADLYPAWSPDGRALVFVSDRSGAMRLWIASDLPPPELLLRHWETVSQHQR